MRRDDKFVRSKDDIAADYEAFGMTQTAGQARLGRARASRLANLMRLGLALPPGIAAAVLFEKRPRFLSNEPLHLTHAQFARDNQFIRSCEAADVKPTAHQASKYRRGFGAAYEARMKERAA